MNGLERIESDHHQQGVAKEEEKQDNSSQDESHRSHHISLHRAVHFTVQRMNPFKAQVTIRSSTKELCWD
jgi:hypothetical protein